MYKGSFPASLIYHPSKTNSPCLGQAAPLFQPLLEFHLEPTVTSYGLPHGTWTTVPSRIFSPASTQHSVLGLRTHKRSFQHLWVYLCWFCEGSYRPHQASSRDC